MKMASMCVERIVIGYVLCVTVFHSKNSDSTLEEKNKYCLTLAVELSSLSVTEENLWEQLQ